MKKHIYGFSEITIPETSGAPTKFIEIFDEKGNKLGQVKSVHLDTIED